MEAEAKKVSDAIDEQIRQEKALLKKQKPDVKVLLLGQSESGKSTTLKRESFFFSYPSFRDGRFGLVQTWVSGLAHEVVDSYCGLVWRVLVDIDVSRCFCVDSYGIFLR